LGPPLYFGIAPPADLIADQAAIKRNATDYEDQEAVALSFIIRISARVTRASFLFMEQPAQRTTARLEGFTKARAGSAETMLGPRDDCPGYEACQCPAFKRGHSRYQRCLGR